MSQPFFFFNTECEYPVQTALEVSGLCGVHRIALEMGSKVPRVRGLLELQQYDFWI